MPIPWSACQAQDVASQLPIHDEVVTCKEDSDEPSTKNVMLVVTATMVWYDTMYCSTAALKLSALKHATLKHRSTETPSIETLSLLSLSEKTVYTMQQ